MSEEIVRQCMYCHTIQYTKQTKIVPSHGVCDRQMCGLEYALDMSLTEKDFELNYKLIKTNE